MIEPVALAESTPLIAQRLASIAIKSDCLMNYAKHILSPKCDMHLDVENTLEF